MQQITLNLKLLDAVHSSLITGLNPPYGFKPRATLARVTPPAQINAEEFANLMEDHLAYLKEEMAVAQAKYEDDTN